MQQKADAEVSAHAKTLARTDSVKAACKYLKQTNHRSALPQILARVRLPPSRILHAHCLLQFLRHTDGLDVSQVGDILGNARPDSLMTEAEYEKLRQAYLDLLDFTGD